MNYGLILEETIKNLKNREKLLLHSCCAPCSSHVITYLNEYFDITVLFYNPNIEPVLEYNKRKHEQIKLCETLNVKFLDCDYDNDFYRESIKGLEFEKEGGSRCVKCFYIRLDKTATLALDYTYFTTTLTVSPHKNSKIINQLGIEIASKYVVKYLPSDFKKNDGYKKSITLSREYNLYRQDYCGCFFSKNNQ